MPKRKKTARNQTRSDSTRKTLSDQRLHTILAALRFYQDKGMGNPANRSDWLHDIATNGDDVISLDEEGIDELCEYLNC
jgi:hypothetical protein